MFDCCWCACSGFSLQISRTFTTDGLHRIANLISKIVRSFLLLFFHTVAVSLLYSKLILISTFMEHYFKEPWHYYSKEFFLLCLALLSFLPVHCPFSLVNSPTYPPTLLPLSIQDLLKPNFKFKLSCPGSVLEPLHDHLPTISTKASFFGTEIDEMTCLLLTEFDLVTMLAGLPAVAFELCSEYVGDLHYIHYIITCIPPGNKLHTCKSVHVCLWTFM